MKTLRNQMYGMLMALVVPLALVSCSGGTSEAERQEAEALVRQGVEQANMVCPTNAGFGMVVTRCSLEGDYVVYEYECDEDYISIDQMNDNKETKPLLKDNVATMAKHDVNFSSFIDACKKAKIGIEYRYVGDYSGKTCIVRLSPSEL